MSIRLTNNTLINKTTQTDVTNSLEVGGNILIDSETPSINLKLGGSGFLADSTIRIRGGLTKYGTVDLNLGSYLYIDSFPQLYTQGIFVEGSVSSWKLETCYNQNINSFGTIEKTGSDGTGLLEIISATDNLNSGGDYILDSIQLTGDSISFYHSSGSVGSSILGGNLTSSGNWLFGYALTDNGVDKVQVGGSILSTGLDKYTTDLSASYTARTKVDKGYVDNLLTGFVSLSGSYSDPSWIVSLDKAKVGLSNVDNTSDIDKPISTATQTALNLKLNSSTASITYQILSQKNVANGYAGLDSSGLISTSQLPPVYFNEEQFSGTGTLADPYSVYIEPPLDLTTLEGYGPNKVLSTDGTTMRWVYPYGYDDSTVPDEPTGDYTLEQTIFINFANEFYPGSESSINNFKPSIAQSTTADGYSMSNLINTSDVATAIDIAIGAPFGGAANSIGSSTGELCIYSDLIVNSGLSVTDSANDSTLVISGLDDTKFYHFYILGAHTDSNTSTKWTIGSSNETKITTGNYPLTTNGDKYTNSSIVRITNIQSTSGVITIAVRKMGSAWENAGINVLEIEQSNIAKV